MRYVIKFIAILVVSWLVVWQLGVADEMLLQQEEVPMCANGKRSYFGYCPEDVKNDSRPPTGYTKPQVVVKPKRRPVDTDDCDASRPPEGGENPCSPQPSVIISRQAFEPEMVDIPAGSFKMGSPSNEEGRSDDEGPVHTVHVKAFQMGKYEVTQGEWQAVMDNNPSRFKDCGERCPVESVVWYQVQEYIVKLNAKTGKNYRLPTEAEWEYAARAGTSTRFSFSNDDSDLGNYAWFVGNSGNKTHPVGEKQPNPWGLYDMHGNVWEWTCSEYTNTYYGNETTCKNRASEASVLRGGSWNSNPRNLRAAYRSWNTDDNRFFNYGVRLVRVF